MKRFMVSVLVVWAALFFCAGMAAAQGSAGDTAQEGKMETATGKVTAIDSQGKGIVINVGSGKDALDVGTVVDNDTRIVVRGQQASLSDIKTGDMVTIRYLRSNDLYAKEIRKR